MATLSSEEEEGKERTGLTPLALTARPVPWVRLGVYGQYDACLCDQSMDAVEWKLGKRKKKEGGKGALAPFDQSMVPSYSGTIKTVQTLCETRPIDRSTVTDKRGRQLSQQFLSTHPSPSSTFLFLLPLFISRHPYASPLQHPHPSPTSRKP